MGLFSDLGRSNHTCPMPKHFAKEADHDILEGISFYHLNMIISGACAAFVCVVMFGLMLHHATHFSNPRQQTKILKICWLIPLYTILSFLSICFPNAYVYLAPWLEFFQAIALGSFFLLLCEFISHDSRSYIDVFFTAFQLPQKKDGEPSPNGLEWFRKKWIAVFQYPVVSFLMCLATDITEGAGIFCLDSDKPYFAHIWITIISEASLAVAVLSALKFYSELKQFLSNHKPMAKLLAFKLIVGLTFIENIIFSILRSTNTLTENSTMTYADVHIGVPNMVICIQMVPFAVFFPFAYNVGPYIISRHDRILDSTNQHSSDGRTEAIGVCYYQGGSLGMRALIQIFNPMEILRAIKFAFQIVTEFRSSGNKAADHMELGYYSQPQAAPYSLPLNTAAKVSYEPLVNQSVHGMQRYE